MTFEEMDLSEMPPEFWFAKLVDREFHRWEAYTPTYIQADIPFNADWWKYVYWIPKIKEEFYRMAISSPDMQKSLMDLYEKYGFDYAFFTKRYSFFLKRLEWMRKNCGSTPIGETQNG